MLVVNPFAPELTFADHVTRTRRDHMKYLTIIRAVTLLFQYQRPTKRTTHAGKVVEYIETTKDDVETGTRLAQAVLGRSLDELPPQTRRLLGLLEAMVDGQAKSKSVSRSHVRFTRRQLREHTSWGPTQVQVHLRRLEELEYVCVHRSGRGQTIEYELVGGIVPEPAVEPHVRPEPVGGYRGGVGPFSGGYRGARIVVSQPETSSILDPHVNGVGNARTGSERENPVVRP
jgi:hypothetical protein